MYETANDTRWWVPPPRIVGPRCPSCGGSTHEEIRQTTVGKVLVRVCNEGETTGCQR